MARTQRLEGEMGQRFADLIEVLKASRDFREKRFVLFCGAGTSLIKGKPAVEQLRQDTVSAAYPEEIQSMPFDEREDKFSEIWTRRDAIAKNRQIEALYWNASSSEGYQALSHLLAKGHFDLVLTSNVSSQIEDAVTAERVSRTVWQSVINGGDSDIIQAELADTTRKFVIFRLCGDLQARNPAIVQSEIEARIEPIGGILQNIFQRGIIIVGYTPFDSEILDHIPREGDRIYFIGEKPPAPDSALTGKLKAREGVSIVNNAWDFNLIFDKIATVLNVIDDVEVIQGHPLTKDQWEKAQKREEPLIEIISTKPLPPKNDASKSSRASGSSKTSEDTQESTEETEQSVAPMVSLIKTSLFTIQVDGNRLVTFNAAGAYNFTGHDSKRWQIDIVDQNALMQNMGNAIATYHREGNKAGRDDWRGDAKDKGSRLYESMMDASPKLKEHLDIARQATTDPEHFTLIFRGPREYLGMPYELLHDEQGPLAVQYPLCRQMDGISSRRNTHFNAFVQSLAGQKQPLRILLIASNTGNLSADEEIQELNQTITAQAEKEKIPVSIDSLPTAEATLSEVKKQLQRCRYHIVHYAGHATFDESTGENSGLRFWAGTGKSGDKKTLTARELKILLDASETYLFYLSTCVGAQIGNAKQLRDNDYLGVMDALIMAGIPCVLGYRWHVTDSGSRRFASLFYKRLFEWPFVPERAVLHARRQIYSDDATDETWTSPILVAQNPYH